MKKVWMVRAGRAGIYAGEFLAQKMTAIGWGKVGDLANVHAREEIAKLVAAAFPEYKPLQVSVAAGQIFRFREELNPASTVLMYEPADRIYRVGTVRGEYRYASAADEELQHTKAVEWTHEVERDSLTAGTKNSLGSIATIFCISDEAAQEIHARLDGVVGVPGDIWTSSYERDFVSRSWTWHEGRSTQLSRW
jgi:restriction system protein